ncbi:MAG TPA: tyrosine-type recombinase/integrase [Syntrophomonadaceae bacterium]|nr:tyrosine-type recombinase/integrase [Syntrophomonadaceae bacterium]HPR92947.1 tyrosine-type recombinase/integrase [Syntrophomonadaceae bacterium]
MAGSVKAIPGKKGVWEIRYDSEDPATGKRKQHRKHFKGTKPQADKYLIEMQSMIHKGEYMELGKILLRDYLKKWIKDYCEPNLASKTLESYKCIINKYILPNMGGIKVNALKAAHIQDYYTLMTKGKKQGGAGLSNTSVLYHHRIFHEALSHAVNWGYIPYNPADRVKPPRKDTPEMKTLSMESAQYVLDNYRDHKTYLPVLLAIKTGMRQGEICGLRWENVDLQTGIISVTHALQRQGKELVLKEPKTKKSRRSIPVPDDVTKELRRVKARQAEDRLSLGKGYDPRGFICAWEDGRPFEPDWVSKQWRKIIKDDAEKAKKELTDRHIPDGVRFHDLRHTHATILLSQGVNLKVVQERLGHESISTTGDIYSHVTPSMQNEAVNALNAVFGN